MSIATRLKQARKFRGYTQDALANTIGVSRGVISNIEYEKTQPQLLVLHAICEVLQIDERWLLTGKGQMDYGPDQEASTRLLLEIYTSAKALSSEEQDYILDMIRTFQKHRDDLKQGNDSGGDSKPRQ